MAKRELPIIAKGMKKSDNWKGRLIIINPEKSEIAKTLDKLAKYLKSSWFRGIALRKAAEFGLNEEEADHFAKVWKHGS